MTGLVNDTCLFLIYEAFGPGKWFECRSGRTAGVRVPEHATAAWMKLPCLLLKARATWDSSEAKSCKARVQLSSYPDKFCSQQRGNQSGGARNGMRNTL